MPFLIGGTLLGCKTTDRSATLSSAAGEADHAWWKEGVAYQVWPRSFKDSNGDGIGDLKGITSKLDYLKDLGIDIVWLNPVYQSPNFDGGYDISDYRAIMDDFGTMADWENLLAQAHKRGMKVIMDLVANHSSDEHQWFVQSRSSKTSPYRDYYYWRAPLNGKEPNNWASFMSGPAWKFDAVTGEYYLHLFTYKQPDLNWNSPGFRKEFYDTMNWWLAKGIDGFRFDAVNAIGKPPGLVDILPVDGTLKNPGPITVNRDSVHDFLRDMNEHTFGNYPNSMTVGELHDITPEMGLDYTSPDRHEVNMAFVFEVIDKNPANNGDLGKWNLARTPVPFIKATFDKWQQTFHGKGWQGIFLGNHDTARMVSTYGDDQQYYQQSAKMLATLVMTMEGTPFIFQGDELGMTNAPLHVLSDFKDVEALNFYNDATTNKAVAPADALRYMAAVARDNSRTPVQWDASPNGGFTTGTPWMAVNPNYTQINAAAEIGDPGSILNYYKKIIKIRKSHLGLIYGSFTQVAADEPQIFAYVRADHNEKLLVVMNYGNTSRNFNATSGLLSLNATLLISNYPDSGSAISGPLVMRPYEARVYSL